ncbi:MAG: hypothetical protein IKL73_00055 [Lachnospiraceae bacterium]|nr:hypothetical protein [Lachnospiraceae bacterium]
MKKFITLLSILILSFLLCSCDTKEASLFYNSIDKYEGFDIATNKISNCCFVGMYSCEQYTDNMEITIPDEYNNIPIERIGGYYGTGVPTPFQIYVNEFINAPEDSRYNGVFTSHPDNFNLTDKYTIKDVSFTLRIGKNINSIVYVIKDCYYPYINEDSSITFYHPVVEIICSNDNEHFYSKDGKLYNKDTDELVTNFSYKNNSNES